MQLAPVFFNKFCIVFASLFTSKMMSKKGNILCIWGFRCGKESKEREGKHFAF